MFTHRFRELLPSQPVFCARAGVGVSCAFVPCPGFGAFSAAHQAQVQEVYRIAAERTREQLRRCWSRRPQFSLN
jgi:hypothetical protein